MVAVVFAFRGWSRRTAKGLLPIILDRRRKLLDARQEGSHLPHIRFTQSLVPCGHSGIADAGANGVEDMPLGIIDGVDDQLRSRRVEGCPERAGLLVEVA